MSLCTALSKLKFPQNYPTLWNSIPKPLSEPSPPDVLKWSANYFQALANGETLPVKERLETPVATQKTDTGLTPGLVSVLHRQLGTKHEVTYNELFEKWQGLCLPTERLEEHSTSRLFWRQHWMAKIPKSGLFQFSRQLNPDNAGYLWNPNARPGRRCRQNWVRGV